MKLERAVSRVPTDTSDLGDRAGVKVWGLWPGLSPWYFTVCPPSVTPSRSRDWMSAEAHNQAKRKQVGSPQG